MAPENESEFARWEVLADDRAFLHAIQEAWLADETAIRALLRDEWFCLRTVGTMRWYLTQEPGADPALVVALIRSSLQHFGKGFLRAMFMGRELGQQLETILSARRVGKTGLLRGLQYAASDGNRDAEILLQWFGAKGSWWERTRAKISLEAVKQYQAGKQAQQSTDPQYPDLIPVDSFKDFRES